MGNKSTFVMLFLIFGMQFVGVNSADGKPSVEPQIKTIQLTQSTQSNTKSQGQINCENRQAKWDSNTSTCSDTDADGTTKSVCISNGGDWSDNELPHCCMDPPAAVAECGQANWDFGTHKCKTITPQVVDAAHPKEKSKANNLDCIQSIRSKIMKCDQATTKAVDTCDMKSSKNSQTQNNLSILSNSAQQMINAGTAQQCKNMALMSAAASYSISGIQADCSSDMLSCSSACDGLEDYSDVDNIKVYCQKNLNGAQAPDENILDAEASRLARIMLSAKSDCLVQNSKVEKFAIAIASGLQAAMKASEQAAKCTQQVCADGSVIDTRMQGNMCKVDPITPACFSNPNAPGCPPNCAQNPTNPQCTCLVNPQAAGCKGPKVSEIAGNPNGPSQNLPSLSGAGGLSSKVGSVGGGGGGSGDNFGELNMGDASEKPAMDQKPTDVPASAAFGVAPAANLGSIGSTGPGVDGKGKNGKAEPASEDHSLFGGVFQNLKNAAGSLFGSGGYGSSSSKKSTAVTNGVNAAGLKPVVGNSALRGIASNGKSCFVDTKGTEFCFGKKNMDIFKMMNSQYGNQYNTLIIDK